MHERERELRAGKLEFAKSERGLCGVFGRSLVALVVLSKLVGNGKTLPSLLKLQEGVQLPLRAEAVSAEQQLIAELREGGLRGRC